MSRQPAFPAVIVSVLFAAGLTSAQTTASTRRKTPGESKPECAQGAICFSGEVSRGQEFRKALDNDLEFVLQAGWEIAIVPKKPEGDCKGFTDAVNPPYYEHRDLYINMSYGHTAEDEVRDSPREFRFVTNCADERTEWERFFIVDGDIAAPKQKYDEAIAKLGSLASSPWLKSAGCPNLLVSKTGWH